jgi:hypothetical protein
MNIAQSSLNFWRAANSPTLILDADQHLSVIAYVFLRSLPMKSRFPIGTPFQRRMS